MTKYYFTVVYTLLALVDDITCLHNLNNKTGNLVKTNKYNDFNSHSMVTEVNVFPYVVAILKKTTYISAGALIDESWVVTGADALFLLREKARELRVRLGSINYKKGGVLSPIKFYEIHPYFSDTKPEFDIALIKLARPVQLSRKLNPIRLQRRVREITATHFIITSWPVPTDKPEDNLQRLLSMEIIKRRRMLSVCHLHPTDTEKCLEEMEGLDINATNTLMCLDPSPGNDPCARDVGAPVVLNGILWGIISSYKPEDCELDPGPSFVSLVSAPDIGPWIHAVVRGHRWSKMQYRVTVSEEHDDEYDEQDDDDGNGDGDEASNYKSIENL